MIRMCTVHLYSHMCNDIRSYITIEYPVESRRGEFGGLRIESVVCCTDCEALRSQFD